jgi:hypothetical protein
MLRSAIRKLGLIFVCILAAVGLTVVAPYLSSSLTGADYTFPTSEDLKSRWAAILIQWDAAWPAIEFFFGSAKTVLQVVTAFVAAIALFIAVLRIKTIAKILRDFLEARGPIHELNTNLTTAGQTSAELSSRVAELQNLSPTIHLTAERLEEAMQALGDLRRQAVVTNGTDDEGGASSAAVAGSGLSNWDALREIWNNNGVRLDQLIEKIPDKKRRLKFAGMDRRSYGDIIDGLQNEGLISAPFAEGSKTIHSKFLGFRNRKDQVPGELIEQFRVLETQLEEDLLMFKPTRRQRAVQSSNVENRMPELL